ncbi:MAG: DNA repair protein RadA [Candidatus Kerfeldbacteria bacterium]|nr:DNA repair protein RadA [Candidatus Kerfeldbacteria bacterium]
MTTCILTGMVVHGAEVDAMALFACSHCDAQSQKWSGRCVECGSWGTLGAAPEQSALVTTKQKTQAAVAHVPAGKTIPFTTKAAVHVERMKTGINEVDRVFGGGIVPGSLMLLGGDPGIGKSTLVAQIAGALKNTVLYVSGEESFEQVQMRFDRLGIDQKYISFLPEEQVEIICKTVQEQKPAFVIIDSIQTVATAAVESEPGSVQQIKASTVRFLEVAKSSRIPMLLIGHVTKGGELGGPKTLEHIVDVVCYLEGDSTHQFRVLRSAKNRFGSTAEVGIFEMQNKGLQEVSNPSERLMKEREQHAGSIVGCVVEGSRVLLVEVQALVNRTAFGFPQRKASGFDLNRLHVLLAVLHKRAHIDLSQHDVYVNLVGGMRMDDPALDLAVCAAIVSALYDVVADQKTIVWGEVGLSGEVRTAPHESQRLSEGKRFGCTHPIYRKTSATIDAALRDAQLLKVKSSVRSS